ncbi:MAG: glycosyltransferase family 39 protein [Anaerolineales bacterium]|nr:glycosyltransferase family 39 protein [Anaerolineales bacterium]
MKSIFKDWKSFFRFLRAVFNTARLQDFSRTVAEAYQAPPPPEPGPVLAPERGIVPWRTLLALFLALAGQYFLEPAIRQVPFSVVLYLAAVGLAVWAFLREEWLLPAPLAPDLPPEVPAYAEGQNPVLATALPDPAGEARPAFSPEPLTVRLIPLGLGLGFAVWSFLSFGNNLFTIGNLLLLFFAVFFFAGAFWLRRPRRRPLPWPRGRKEWTRVLLSAGLVGLVVAIIAFFRLYQLNGVPAEPFSDHAEKILDVYEVTLGQTHIFFLRNTGREALQMYLTAAVARIFKTGLSFLSLKIGTVICGLLTLPYIYLLGKELGGKRVAMLALFLAGVAYWPNVISRAGLRFPLYPLFVAPVLFHIMRGLRNQNRNDFIWVGIFLGLGLHGYSPFRIVPLVVAAGLAVYLLHLRTKQAATRSAVWLSVVTILTLVIFLPLLRYAVDNPEFFSYRALSRLGSFEQPLPGPALEVFASNVWKGLLMFNWDDGEIWAHSVTHRPALDIIGGALFLLGVVLLLARYVRRRDWRDLFLLLSIPLLQLPSTLSLAFPAENPALNRAGGAYVPAFVIAALALEGLAAALRSRMSRRIASLAAEGLVVLLLLWSSFQNFDLVFNQYERAFRSGAWNSSEMGQVILDFEERYGTAETVWIAAYPHWVDTRLPAVWAGIPNRDMGIWPEQMQVTLAIPGPKLFLLRPDDSAALDRLQQLYPQGELRRYTSPVEGHDFLIYLVPESLQP